MEPEVSSTRTTYALLPTLVVVFLYCTFTVTSNRFSVPVAVTVLLTATSAFCLVVWVPSAS